MGCDYIQCDDCGISRSEDIVHQVDIEGYDTLFICDDCLSNTAHFTAMPSEFFIAPDDAFAFCVPGYQTLEGKPLVFDSFRALSVFVGDNETNVKFGIVGDSDFLTTDLDALRLRCERKVWEQEHHHGEDNTKYVPTPAWWEMEKMRIDNRIKSLVKKRKVLEEM